MIITQIIELKRSSINENYVSRNKPQYAREDQEKRLPKCVVEVDIIKYNMTKDLGLCNEHHKE
jgi:hypothetical protein